MKGTKGDFKIVIKIHTCATKKIYAVGINTGKIQKNTEFQKKKTYYGHIVNIL